MEALPIFLDNLVVSWLAVVISVTFVLVFGEIIPQALFSSNPLKSGYKLYYLVLAMKWTLYPICKPLAWLLDLMFGEHEGKGIVFSQKEVNMITAEIAKHPDERMVVEGALKIAEYTVTESCVAWDEVIAFDANTRLDADGLRAIYKTGFSRIPIFKETKDNIIGILLVKTLILCDPDPDLTIYQFLQQRFGDIPVPLLVAPNTPLYDCINLFQERKTQIAMVCEEERHIVIAKHWKNGQQMPRDVKWTGIITLEDIMEDIIQEEIPDEFDNQSPLNAILEMKVSDNPGLTRLNSWKSSNWTDDESFAECVKSRFDAKNRRARRARISKERRKGNFNLLSVPLSDYEANTPRYTPAFEMNNQSQSQSSILSKPLLPNESAINTPNSNPQIVVSAQQ